MLNPTRPRLRGFVASLAAAAVVLGLGACSTVPTVATVPVAAGALVEHAAHSYGTAKVIDDTKTESVLLVPVKATDSLAVFVHGSGQSQYTILQRPGEYGVGRELVEHGYLVLAANAGGRQWGNPASVADYTRLIRSTMERYRVRNVFLMAESMGGLATMQLAAALPEVRAVTAWYPVCDLRTMERKPHYAAAIEAAWAGKDRSAVSPVRVPRVPMMIWASPSDTVVQASRNAAYCASSEQADGGTVSYIHTVGQHGDPSNFRPKDVLRFFDEHRATTLAAADAGTPKTATHRGS